MDFTNGPGGSEVHGPYVSQTMTFVYVTLQKSSSFSCLSGCGYFVPYLFPPFDSHMLELAAKCSEGDNT